MCKPFEMRPAPRTPTLMISERARHGSSLLSIRVTFNSRPSWLDSLWRASILCNLLHAFNRE